MQFFPWQSCRLAVITAGIVGSIGRLCLVACTLIGLTRAQTAVAQPCNQRIVLPGSVDSCLGMTTGLDEEAFAVVLQPDGKIVVGGGFGRYDGRTFKRIVRLDATGVPDPAFVGGDVLSTTDGGVYDMALQPDGKLVLVGEFMIQTPNGTGRGIRRLLADGSPDAGFRPFGLNSTVWCVALHDSGKILVGGGFTRNGGGQRLGRIARLTSAGEVDPTFNVGTGFDGSVLAMLVQPDGKVLVGGGFRAFNGVPRRNIARLNGDGSLDTSFRVDPGPDASIYALALRPDGKIMVGGHFRYYDRAFRQYLARIQPNGVLDPTFRDPVLNGFVESIAVQPDGKVLVGGSFDSPGRRIARFDTNGANDNRFNNWSSGFQVAGGGFVDVNALVLQPDGRAIAVGRFDTYNGVARKNVARLYTSTTPLVSNKATLQRADLRPMPNPASTGFVLQGLPSSTEVRLYDVLGRQVLSSTMAPGQSVDLRGLLPGLYRWTAGESKGSLMVR